MSRNLYSHYTAKNREKPSFPTKWLFERKMISGRTLDYGCGFGADTTFLRKEGLDIVGFDPYYLPKPPTGKFQTIICQYVLNVLLPEEQTRVIMDISELLEEGGNAFFAVRRDLKYQGFRTHRVHKKPTYQCVVSLPFKSVLKNEFCEIYEYQHFNLIAKKSDCVFCNPGTSVITESATAYIIKDGFPISPGHLLVIPKRHVTDYFQLSSKEQRAIWLLAKRAKGHLQRQLNPDGFNVGFNMGEAAGQTISHAHVHIIPRYKGDVQNPRGGIRHVIPGKADYQQN